MTNLVFHVFTMVNVLLVTIYINFL